MEVFNIIILIAIFGILILIKINQKMNTTRKKVKREGGSESPIDKAKISTIYDSMMKAQLNNEPHQLSSLLKADEKKKHPILPTVSSFMDVYKINLDRRKKPIDMYLDTVNQIYKKKDLDILINPLNYTSAYENWSPRQIAIFQTGILKFGKQFEFLSELIETKNPKEVYEFYLEWKTSSHYKTFKTSITSKNNHDEWV